MNSLLRTFVRLFAGLAACLAVAAPATAQTTPQCQTLFAGQSINVGSVCVSNDNSYLTVTYAVVSGWTIDETHLFVGGSTAEIPQTTTGNPKIGNFPYATNPEGSTQVFKLPLKDFGVECPSTKPLTIAAHAVVRNTNTQKTETAWGNGTRMVAKGNWAMYFSYTPACTPVVSTCTAPETAFAKTGAAQTFIELGLTDSRWGWQMPVTAGSSGTAELWMGAAQNDTSKGKLVGYVSYFYWNGSLNLTYQVSSQFGLQGTQVYAGDVNATTIAPGQYGKQKDGLSGTTVTYDIPVSDTNGDGTIFVIAHAEVCKR